MTNDAKRGSVPLRLLLLAPAAAAVGWLAILPVAGAIHAAQCHHPSDVPDSHPCAVCCHLLPDFAVADPSPALPGPGAYDPRPPAAPSGERAGAAATSGARAPPARSSR